MIQWNWVRPNTSVTLSGQFAFQGSLRAPESIISTMSMTVQLDHLRLQSALHVPLPLTHVIERRVVCVVVLQSPLLSIYRPHLHAQQPWQYQTTWSDSPRNDTFLLSINFKLQDQSRHPVWLLDFFVLFCFCLPASVPFGPHLCEETARASGKKKNYLVSMFWVFYVTYNGKGFFCPFV